MHTSRFFFLSLFTLLSIVGGLNCVVLSQTGASTAPGELTMLGLSGKEAFGVAIICVLIVAYGRPITSRLPGSQV